MTAFEQWHKDNAKYMEPADIVPWCIDAWHAALEHAAKICEEIRSGYTPMSSVDGPFEGVDICVDAIRKEISK